MSKSDSVSVLNLFLPCIVRSTDKVFWRWQNTMTVLPEKYKEWGWRIYWRRQNGRRTRELDSGKRKERRLRHWRTISLWEIWYFDESIDPSFVRETLCLDWQTSKDEPRLSLLVLWLECCVTEKASRENDGTETSHVVSVCEHDCKSMCRDDFLSLLSFLSCFPALIADVVHSHSHKFDTRNKKLRVYMCFCLFRQWRHHKKTFCVWRSQREGWLILAETVKTTKTVTVTKTRLHLLFSLPEEEATKSLSLMTRSLFLKTLGKNFVLLRSCHQDLPFWKYLSPSQLSFLSLLDLKH